MNGIYMAEGAMERNKITNIGLLIICIILGIILFLSPEAQALPENISIISPVWDSMNDPMTSDFPIIVQITDTNIKQVQAKIIGAGTWQTLEQSTNINWEGTISVSSVNSGTYQLTARYLRNGETVYYYVPATTKIIIQKPVVVPQYGSISLTIRDSNNQPIQGVLVMPGNNQTDADGLVSIRGQPLNTAINFTLTKSKYNTSYLDITFTSNQTVIKSVTMGRVGGDLREFVVQGYEGMEAGRGTFVIVTDLYDGTKVDGAAINVYDGANVKSSPGVTVNGRLFVSLPGDTQTGQYLIEVTKQGYRDWSDTMAVFAVKKTPTPSPTPTPQQTPAPVPTLLEIYRPDANMKLTDAEYQAWQDKQRSDANLRNASMNSQTVVQQPQQDSGIPWNLIGLVIFGGVVVAYKLKEGRKQNPGDANGVEKLNREDIFDVESTSQSSKKVIKCDGCDWCIEIDPKLGEAAKGVAEAALASHKEEAKHGSPKKAPKKAAEK